MAILPLVLSLVLSAQPNTEVQAPPVRLVPGLGERSSGEVSSGPTASGGSSAAAGGRADSLPGIGGAPKDSRGLGATPGGGASPPGQAPGASSGKSSAAAGPTLSAGSATADGGAASVPSSGSSRLLPPGGFPSTGIGAAPSGLSSAPSGVSGTIPGAPSGAGVDGTSGGGLPRAGATPGNAATGSAAGPAGTTPGRVSPSAMLAEMLTLPNPSAITGRAVTLLEGLSAARDPGRQAEVVHGYWRLVEALGAYRAAFDAVTRLGLQVRPEDAPMLRAAQAAAQAALQAAAARATVAQHELGEAALVNPASGLPIPADLPHVGGYRTGFDEVYAMRGVLPQARLLHRVLPVRRQAIEARAAAVQAAEDALQAIAEAYAAGRADLAAVLAAVDHWTGQRQAFLATVCQYNHDIADYALAVSGPVVASQSLVSMLIVPGVRAGSPAAQPASPGGSGRPVPGGASSGPAPSGVTPATALEPVVDAQLSQPGGSASQPGTIQIPAWGIPLEKSGLPAHAPGLLSPSHQEPTLAPPPGNRASEGTSSSAFAPTPGSGARASSESSQAESKEARSSDLVFPPAPMERVVRRFAAQASDSPAAMAMFAGLADASPALRATQLSRMLHTSVAEGGEEVRRVELGELLRSYLAADRRGLIRAYWTAACRAGQYQALVRQSELLEGLVPAAVEHRRKPSGAREMLQVRAQQLQAHAEQLEAKARLLAAQFELTERSGRPLEAVWLLPATPPHAGPYRLQLESQSAELVNTWRLRGLAASVSAHWEGVQRQAAAVVAADLARAEATASYLRGTGRVEVVLSAIESYTRQTLAFLEGVAQYNHAIGDYALTVVPPTIAGDQLLRTLVVVK